MLFITAFPGSAQHLEHSGHSVSWEALYEWIKGKAGKRGNKSETWIKTTHKQLDNIAYKKKGSVEMDWNENIKNILTEMLLDLPITIV